MPRITIDGNKFEFEVQKTVLQVALENDVLIPHYCYHPGLSIVASCRICLAEIAQPNPRNDNKVELLPKLLPTCQISAIDGMVVHTNSPKVIANQKAVMEYLLINHPLDCPVCDQAGECDLQDYSYRYGRAESRFEEAKIKQPKKDIGSHILLYADRCIMCSRCVRFTREITGTGEIGVFGRGSAEQIDVFPGTPLDNELSGNVADICPVGALLDKEFLFKQRVWYLTQAASIDGLTASGDNICIEHNEGIIYRVKPRTNLEVNQWWISDEIRYGWKFVHSKDRLLSPMRQQYGQQLECHWSKAYDEIRNALTTTVREQGFGSLAVLISPMLPCEEAYLLGRFITSLDPQATLGIGPVPVDGQDKTFPGGYTIYAEKCPNQRGVRRALEMVGDLVLDYDQFLARLSVQSTPVAATLLTGNYPSSWVNKDLVSTLRKKFVVLIDTLPNDLTAKADVFLPGATWAEKAGTFENANNRLQSFSQAIGVVEQAKTEGQIALDLHAACGLAELSIYDAPQIRRVMGSVLVTDVYHAPPQQPRQTNLQYVEL